MKVGDIVTFKEKFRWSEMWNGASITRINGEMIYITHPIAGGGTTSIDTVRSVRNFPAINPYEVYEDHDDLFPNQ